MANPAAPPPLLHRPSFTSLPDEIIVNCLARISISYYLYLCLVSKSFYSLLSSPDLYAARSQIGNTESRVYVCLRLPTATHHRWFSLYDPGQTIITNGGEIKGELRLVPVKLSSSYSPARLNATNVAVGSEIYQIGGSNKDKRSRAVRVLDCRSHTWRRGPKTLVARKSANSCFLDGKIYVMGGCKKKEEAMNWGEVFDLKTQTWKSLPSPSDDGFDPSYKIRVREGRLYVITIRNKYAYDSKEGRWLLLDVGFAGVHEHGFRILLGAWCVIENITFIVGGGKCMWYERGRCLMVEGLEDLYMKRAPRYRIIQLLNYGGKLVVIWHERIDALEPWRVVWCAVVKLEKRFSSVGPEIWGVIERCNVVVPRVHKSYNLSTCLSVSV